MGLVSVEEGREYLPGVGAGTEPAVGRLIERVSSAIAAHLGYPSRSASLGPTLESASYTLTSGGEPAVWVVDDGMALVLPVRPITAITSIHDDPDEWSYAAATLVSANDYTYDAMTGRVYLKPSRSHGAFSSSSRAVRVVATCGWVTVPDPIREACIRTCQAWWVARRAGAHQETPDVAGDAGALPAAVRELLAPYSVATGWVL